MQRFSIFISGNTANAQNALPQTIPSVLRSPTNIDLVSTIATFDVTFSFEQFFSESHRLTRVVQKKKTDQDREKPSKFKPKLIDRAESGQR